MDKLNNAISIFNFTDGQYSLVDIKAIYRRLASQNHPDKGGNTEIMQLINTAYEELIQHFESAEILDVTKIDPLSKINLSFIQELKVMQGVHIEVCGYWVWLSGNTYEYKDQIHKLGFKYSKSKKLWYWFPNMYKHTYKRGCKSMSHIRQQYGSAIIETNRIQQLN